uniref:Uncharacterized protein n=1 Tax=uncultured bacterium fosmid pJB16B1 TaxID=1478054 RepID=A0A0H3U7G2_9BACT|nr:hypothetical protein [uncultured bacterium fosmid pJB16B1]
MKAKLVYKDGTLNGRPEKFVTLRSVRTAYASSLPKCLAARGQNSHADPILWQEELGIRPYSPDGITKRTCLIANEFHAVVDKYGWKVDDVVEEAEVDDDNGEEFYSLESANSILLQIINQKLDKIMSELGVDFVIDDAKLMKMIEK